MTTYIETVLQHAKNDSLYIRDSLSNAFETRCTFGDCEGLSFSGCHSEFLDAECIKENPLIGQCINVSCEEVRDFTYAAGEIIQVETLAADESGDKGFASPR